MKKNVNKLPPKTPLINSPLLLSIFSISKLSLSMLPIKKKLLTSYGKIMTLLDTHSGMLNIKDTKEKELNCILPPTLKTPLYKDLILSENTFSELSESTEMKETTKSEESGYGEELKFPNIFLKIYPTSNITIGLSLITLMLSTENSSKSTGLDSIWVSPKLTD
jgi:hypothetical protein